MYQTILIFELQILIKCLFRRQLRKAVVDHVSDSFLEPDAPLHLLIAAAKEGNEKEVDEHAQVSSFLITDKRDFFFLKKWAPFSEFIDIPSFSIYRYSMSMQINWSRLLIWPVQCLETTTVSKWSDMQQHK